MVPAEAVRESPLRHLVRTFFRGSPSKAVLTVLDSPSTRLSEEKLNELASWVEAAKRGQRP
ncbi:MAG: hypothetical protein ABIQ49_03770 [Gemmatimonadales bacterium]